MFLNLAKVIGIIERKVFADTVMRIVRKGWIALAHFLFLFFVLPRNSKSQTLDECNRSVRT